MSCLPTDVKDMKRMRVRMSMSHGIYVHTRLMYHSCVVSVQVQCTLGLRKYSCKGTEVVSGKKTAPFAHCYMSLFADQAA